jgi:hypothetical protein
MTALMIVGLLLVLIVLVGNTMIAVAFLRSRGGWKGMQGRDREAMDELHKRVQALPPRHR